MERLDCWLGSVAERLFPRTIHDQVFAQILLDLREEQAEALAQRRVWKARAVHLLYTIRFSFCLMALLGKEDVMIRNLKVRWSLLTMAGLAVGILAALVFGEPIEAVVGMILVTPVLTLLVGAVLGAGQWLDLRHRVSGARLWIVATCLGVGAGLAGGVVIVELTGRWLTGEQIRIVQLGVATRALSFAVVGLVMGFCTGAAQWIGVLRRQGAPARGWIAVSALSLGLSFSMSSLIVDTLLGGLASPVGVISLVLLTGLFFGAGTARAIARAT